jgi:hypothetical protein
VYRFASPQSQLRAQSYERFLSMLGNAVYRPLVGHREAQVLRSVQMAKDKACVVVGECRAPFSRAPWGPVLRMMRPLGGPCGRSCGMRGSWQASLDGCFWQRGMLLALAHHVMACWF